MYTVKCGLASLLPRPTRYPLREAAEEAAATITRIFIVNAWVEDEDGQIVARYYDGHEV